MWTLVHDMICAVLCAVGSGFWHCLFWRGYSCIGRTWIASATWGCGLNLCAWFSLREGFPCTLFVGIIWSDLLWSRQDIFRQDMWGSRWPQGILVRLVIYIYIYIIRIYNILLYYLGTVLSCYSACSAHLPSNKCFFPYSVSLSQEPRGALLGTFQNHWYLHRQRHSHIIIYYPYFILPVHGFVSVQAITKYCELHKLGEHRKPVFGNVWKQLLASLAWHSLTILANYLPIFT